MFSPPKRRKISDGTSIAVEASGSLAPHNETRSPGRPSFQSPTRSSLAKSHPEILQRALSRSPSRQPASKKGQDGRSEQSKTASLGLRGRKALRRSLTSSPLKALRVSGDTPISSPNRHLSGTQSFSKPPRRLSKRILPTDFDFGSPLGKPLRPAGQDLSNTPEDQLALELGSTTRDPTREELKDIKWGGEFMDGDSLEPDLPPTPTQLGLEKAPDRPRGLLSSSPSARQEKRLGKRKADALQGSPLKSSSLYPTGPETEPLPRDGFGPASEQKHTRRTLLTELQQLRNDVAYLTKWTEKIGTDATFEDSRELGKCLNLLAQESSHLYRPSLQKVSEPMSSLLSNLLPFSANLPRPARSTSVLPTNPFALKQISQRSSYLTVFAPLALRARTSRTMSPGANGLRETHTLTFTAPSPFPSRLYNSSVIYDTDLETQSLVSLTVPTGSKNKKRRLPEPLRQWIDSRLSNPLLRLDVATICWGINRYWEVSMARAQLWAQIEHKYGSVSPTHRAGDARSEPQTGIVTLPELQRLIPHIERSTMVVVPKSSNNGLQVLLSNSLVMEEWTGEPQLRPEISVSAGAASRRIDQEAKKLFQTLLCEERPGASRAIEGEFHFDAIMRATEGALGALFGTA